MICFLGGSNLCFQIKGVRLSGTSTKDKTLREVHFGYRHAAFSQPQEVRLSPTVDHFRPSSRQNRRKKLECDESHVLRSNICHIFFPGVLPWEQVLTWDLQTFSFSGSSACSPLPFIIESPSPPGSIAGTNGMRGAWA